MKLHDLKCQLIHETEHAVLVTIDGNYKAWLPKNAIEIERKPGSNMVVVTAPESLLFDKELI